MPPKGFTDDEMCAVIDAIRAEHGACTLSEMAARTGMSRAGCDARVKDLVRQGRVRQSHIYGSIRTNPECLDSKPEDGE